MKFIAHRGESMDAPENTLEAFRLAWERDTDGIEGDFYLLKDGHIACMHDAKALRTTGVDVHLSSLDKTAVKELDAGSWKHQQWQGAKVPLLDEVATTIPDGKCIYVEIKDDSAQIINWLAEAIAAGRLAAEQLIVISFADDVVKAAKELLPDSKALLLTGLGYEKETGFTPSVDELKARMQRIQADGVDCSQSSLTPGFVREIKNAGYEFHVWTVNEVDRARELIAMGVDSITSDCAGHLKKMLCSK